MTTFLIGQVMDDGVYPKSNREALKGIIKKTTPPHSCELGGKNPAGCNVGNNPGQEQMKEHQLGDACDSRQKLIVVWSTVTKVEMKKCGLGRCLLMIR